MLRFSIGLVPLLVLGCGSDVPVQQNNQVDDISTEKTSPQERASSILSQLESNIAQDVPQIVQEQEIKQIDL